MKTSLLLLPFLLIGCLDAGSPSFQLEPVAPNEPQPEAALPTTFTFRYALVVPEGNHPFVDCAEANTPTVRIQVALVGTGNDFFTQDIPCTGGDANQDGALQFQELGVASITMPGPGEWFMQVALLDANGHAHRVTRQPTEFIPSPTEARDFRFVHLEPGANYGHFSEGVTPGAMVFKMLCPDFCPANHND